MVNEHTFKVPLNMIISGSTMSGKTTLMKQILNNNIIPQIDWLIIMSPTMQYSRDYEEYIENTNPDSPKLKLVKVDKDFQNVAAEIVDSQKKLMLSNPNQTPQICILFDDLIGNKMIKNFGLLDEFSAKSRHINISMIFITQKISAISRTIRLNSSVVIILSNFNHSENEQFVAQYVPKKYKSKMLDKIENIFSKKYNYLLCDNRHPEVNKRLFINGTDSINFDEL